MAFIEVSDLVREFRSYRRFSGPLEPGRSLFTRQYDVRRALDGVSFTIARRGRRLRRAQRRRQVDHDQDPDRHPRPGMRGFAYEDCIGYWWDVH